MKPKSKPSKFSYVITYSIDVRKVSKPLSEVFDAIKQNLRDFGVREQLQVRADIVSFCVTFPHRLTEEKKNVFLPAFTQGLRDHLPSYDLQLSSFQPLYKVRPRPYGFR